MPQTVEKDSLFETLLGNGLDIRLGLVPGAGIALTGLNVGLSLFGKDTVGQHLASAIMNGDPNNRYVG